MKDDNVKKIEKLNVGDKIQKFNLFVIGTFLSALGFNLFISPYNIVTGGSTGIALIVKQYFNINISLFVLIINICPKKQINPPTKKLLNITTTLILSPNFNRMTDSWNSISLLTA